MSDVPPDIHEFLLDRNATLRDSCRDIPLIREHIQNLPQTASTFRLGQIDDVYPPTYEDVHVEFCGAWRMHDIYEPSRDRVYVNPNYVHCHEFTDLVVDCQCGAKLTRNYDDEHNSLRDEHTHNADCLPFHRLNARASMSRQRYDIAKHCGRIGWNGKQMAMRMGVKPTSIGQTLKHYGLSVQDLRDDFRARAARTYQYLIDFADVTGELIADIYGVSRTTMGRWAASYCT
jgi:hypothetical protein